MKVITIGNGEWSIQTGYHEKRRYIGFAELQEPCADGEELQIVPFEEHEVVIFVENVEACNVLINQVIRLISAWR